MPYANSEDRDKNNKEYRRKHKAALDKYAKKYRKQNREDILEYLREWKKDNPDYDREWQAAHRPNKRKNQREYRQSHPERIRALNAAYATKKTGAGGKFTEEEWINLKRSCRFRCLKCGKRKKLFPDHVKPVSKGGSSNIDNIQPLCGTCNSVKNNKFIDYR